MDFVLRVEAQRRELGMNERETYRAFVHGLEPGLRAHLNVVRMMVQQVGMGRVFGWTDVVKACRDIAAGCMRKHSRKCWGQRAR